MDVLFAFLERAGVLDGLTDAKWRFAHVSPFLSTDINVEFSLYPSFWIPTTLVVFSCRGKSAGIRFRPSFTGENDISTSH
jgi:hypothetical protein